jgi:nucleoside phosphorylase
MALEDYFEAEVGIAVAATAALFSPKVRKVLRRGAVYGVAGALMAGDAVVGFAKGVGRGAQQAAASASKTSETPPKPTETAATSAASATKSTARKVEEAPATDDAKGTRRGVGGPAK